MAFGLLQLYLLLAPGYALTMLLGIGRQQLLFSITFSFAILIVLVSLARNYLWPFQGFVIFYLALPLVIVLLMAVFYPRGFQIQKKSLVEFSGDLPAIAGLGIVVAGYVVWYVVTGPYTEVPSDLYRHLEFTQYYNEFIAGGSFGPPLTLTQIATQHGGFWYVLLALCSLLTNTSPMDTLYPVMFNGGLLFLIATYLFSRELFRPLKLQRLALVAAAVLSCLFMVLQTGVNAFSFVRYYSYAPAMLNSVVMMTALLCLLDLLQGVTDENRVARRITPALNGFLLLLFCALVALVMHRQEGVFVAVMVITLCVWLLFDRVAGWLSVLPGGRPGGYLMAVLLAVAGGLLCFLVLTGIFDRASIPASGSGKVVALPVPWPGYGPLHILNPKFQFAEVVTIWGAVVIVGFIAWFDFFRRQPLLVAGMLTPFLTVFNPLFVDLFLRLEDDHSLWRFCFLMPLAAVASLLLVQGVSKWRLIAGYKRGLVVILTAALVVLPFTPSLNRFVRSTNLPVAEANSYRLWQDVLRYLESLPESERILTDPVTGYVVSGLTSHRTFRYKFFASDLYQAFRFAFESYDDAPLSRYRGWLLVVNQRNGAFSTTGQATGHWPGDIMQVDRYYPQSLLQHLKDNPERFDKLWSADRISVYRILR